MLPAYKKEAILRLKVASGHLEAVRRMVENEDYCVDLMKQLAAVQGTLVRVQQIFLRNHLSTCVSTAIKNGMGEAIIEELMGALKYDSSLVDGRAAAGLDLPVDTEEPVAVAPSLSAQCCAPAAAPEPVASGERRNAR